MEDFLIFSDDLKSQLKWLEENKNPSDNISGIKQQKFLLFYNLFLKVNKKGGNFNGLCAWKGGPVYTQVHAAVKHHYTIKEIISSIKTQTNIDTTLAIIAKFIVEILSDEEVSEITHEFDFWKTVPNNYQNNEIKEEYISLEDEVRIKKILNTYDIDFIINHRVYKTKNATFLIHKNDYELVTTNFKKKLEKIRNDKPIKIDLENKDQIIEKTINKISI